MGSECCLTLKQLACSVSAQNSRRAKNQNQRGPGAAAPAAPAPAAVPDKLQFFRLNPVEPFALRARTQLRTHARTHARNANETEIDFPVAG